LDPRQEESAQLLGASPKRWFYTIAMPQLHPSLKAAYLIAFLAIIKELPVTLLLGGATGMKTLAFRIWDRYEEALWHDAGLSGLILLCTSLVLCLITLRWRRHV
ncbi:MAG: ABC transporter permease subunit, partial [Myxococcota bacterium]|nr:ABC transporter permease subunit [Myxococcota bacterium]